MDAKEIQRQTRKLRREVGDLVKARDIALARKDRDKAQQYQERIIGKLDAIDAMSGTEETVYENS